MGLNTSFGNIFQGTREFDTLTGDSGPDQIFAYEGDDTLRGLQGNDVLLAGSGDDVLNGGAGDDVLDGGSGINLLSGGDGNDVLLAGPDANLMLGGDGADQLVGNNGVDAMLGGAGDDVLFGGRGTDAVIGGAGADVLDTGMGLGVHHGGEGSDTFRIGNDILDNGQADRIIALDFTAGEDLLELGDGIIEAVTGVQDAEIDLSPVVQAVEDSGLVDVESLAAHLGALEGGGTLAAEAGGALSFFTPDTAGNVTAAGASVFLRDGDRIDVVGVSREALLGVIG